MGFKDTKTEDEERVVIRSVADLLKYLSGTTGTIEAELEDTQEVSRESLLEKLGLVVDNELDKLLDGDIVLEDAKELETLVTAVTHFTEWLPKSE